jgi:phosphate transport system permease protein
MSRDNSPLTGLPEGQAATQQLQGRHQAGWLWQAWFLLATCIGIIGLTALLLNIVDRAFGYIAYEDKVKIETVSDRPLSELNKDELVALLQSELSKGAFNKLDKDQPFTTRSRDDVQALVLERVIQRKVVETWSLWESLTNRPGIEARLAEDHPEASLEFRSWLTPAFVSNPMASQAEYAGVRTAVLGSLWLIAITILIALPIGVGAAIYLQEYADHTTWFNRVIETNIYNLAGVPSIVYGILGLAVFVRALEPFSSGALFGVTDSNGRTIISAALTMALLILPLIIVNAQEAIKAVPDSLRQAAYGLGATKWQTIWTHVLPNALPGILTGSILAISRAIGETAPLIVIGASTFITVDPDGVFSKFTALPIQIYNWTSRPQGEFRNIAAAAILVLLIMLLTLNATAIALRNRFSRRLY